MKKTGLLACLFVSAAAIAEGPIDYERQFDSCLARNNGQPITGTLGNCADEVSDAADIELNSLAVSIDKHLSKKSPSEINAFQAAQVAWRDYQAATCQLNGQFVAGVEYSICPMKLKVARIKELRELLLSLAMMPN